MSFRSWMDGTLKEQLRGNNGAPIRDFTVRDLLERLTLPDDVRIYRRDDNAPAGGPGFAAGSAEDLTEQVNPKPPADYGSANWDTYEWPLKLVAAELRTQSKIVFPQDAPLFYVSGGRWGGRGGAP